MQIQVLREIGRELPGAPGKDPEQEKDGTEAPEKGLFCRFCGRYIASHDDRIDREGRHFHTFFNPAGIIYEIRCFRRAGGVRWMSEFTADFSWFAEYSWSIVSCAGCGRHMGWYFRGGDDAFFGLIAAHLSG